jgi:hypothetical protein
MPPITIAISDATSAGGESHQPWRKATVAVLTRPITSDSGVIPCGYNEQSSLYSKWESRSQL